MASYDVVYEDCYEPYIICSIDKVPLYDERFQGYRMNKISHIFALHHQQKMKFSVLLGHFVVADEHERSTSWSKTYNSSTLMSGPSRKHHIQALWHIYKTNILDGKCPVVSSSTSSRLQSEISPILSDSESDRVQVTNTRSQGKSHIEDNYIPIKT